MERQAKDQHQKLHLTEMDLATESKVVSCLKAELQKAKDVARVAREAAETTMKAPYECGVHDAKTRLVEEVAIMCKDYCIELWVVALDRAEVPVNSKLRSSENVFFPEDIREIPDMVPPPK